MLTMNLIIIFILFKIDKQAKTMVIRKNRHNLKITIKIKKVFAKNVCLVYIKKSNF